jgi:hypothetical protein
MSDSLCIGSRMSLEDRLNVKSFQSDLLFLGCTSLKNEVRGKACIFPLLILG